MQLPRRSTLLRHRLISSLRDLDIRGIRRLSVWLPKVLLPNVQDIPEHILQTIHGVSLRVDPANDSGVERELYETGTYEKGTIQLLQQFLKPGDTFVDVGANIGLMTCIASKLVGPGGTVIAVEPNPSTAQILQDNLRINQCENVVVEPRGLARNAGSTKLFENRKVNRGGASLLNQSGEDENENPSHEIELTTLDFLVGSRPVKLIKIDVEGLELEVLKGGQSVLNSFPILIVEVSDSRHSGLSATPAEVYQFLHSLNGYRFYRQKGTKERRSRLVEITDSSKLPQHDNLICIAK